MTNQQNSDDENCNNSHSQGDFLPPEAHDLTTVDQKVDLDLDTCGVYWVKRECTRDGCQAGFRGFKPVGRTLETVQDYKDIAYELYESYYDNPRQISYPTVQALVQDSNPGRRNAITDDFCDAAKIGRLDAEEDREKRTRQAVFDTVLPENLN